MDTIVLDENVFEGIEIPKEFLGNGEETSNVNSEQEETEIVEDTQKELPENKTDALENEEYTTKEEETKKDNTASKKVPLSELLNERKKWQQKIKEVEEKAKLADKLALLTNKTHDQIIEEIKSLEAGAMVDDEGNPIPEKYAKRLIELENANKEIANKARIKAFETEIDGLKTNPLYASIDLKKEEVIEFADKHSMSAKQAYNALYGDDIYKDMETIIHQRIMANLHKKQAAKIDTNGKASDTKPKIDLSNDELEIAKLAGITPQEYYNAKHMK